MVTLEKIHVTGSLQIPFADKLYFEKKKTKTKTLKNIFSKAQTLPRFYFIYKVRRDTAIVNDIG